MEFPDPIVNSEYFGYHHDRQWWICTRVLPGALYEFRAKQDPLSGMTLFKDTWIQAKNERQMGAM
jgi:hypothetical protein